MARLRISWLAWTSLVVWVLVHAIPQFNVDTQFYSPNAVLPDNSRYYGDVRNGMFYGQGKLVWASGDIYEGEFVDGVFHGRGKIRYLSGDVLSGQFQGGYAEGEGTLVYAEGGRYSGGFSLGYFHGKGRLEYKNNAFYEGDFERGKFSGQGEYFHNEQRYLGTFVDGEIVSGRHEDGAGNRYSGEFLSSMYHGPGTYRAATGDVYEGNFVDGMLNGEGSHVTPDGTVYRGYFKNNLYHGDGEFNSIRGKRYTGEFEYGLYHGEGKLRYIDDNGNVIVQEGHWQFGNYEVPEGTEKVARPTAENLLYNQTSLIELTKSSLTAQDPDKIDLYFLGVAGDGSQDVFLKEINFVENKLDEMFDIQGRSARLVNNIKTTDKHPVVTQFSLDEVLAHLADVMDVDNDILFLYMTSHGSAEHEFYVNDLRVSLADISAEALANSLRQVPIKWRVVMVSACYSGGFIPYLKNDTSLIMTAARADRQSFGCSNDSEMTYFGKAYFRETLNEKLTFLEAFNETLQVVEKWEDEDEVSAHSEPQFYMGEAMSEHLRKWRQQRTQ